MASERRLETAEYTELLSSWQKIDQDYLFAHARTVATNVYGDNIFIRGLIEITNYCKNNCFYCGIRKGNRNAMRYRLDNTQILACCAHGYDLGFRTFVLQGGEDLGLSEPSLCSLIEEIKQKFPDAAVTLSLGEKTPQNYASYRTAGADRYLLRHETADASHYATLHPEAMSFAHRMECLRQLKSLGFQTGAGLMVGSPNQTTATLVKDLEFLAQLKPHMVGIGPFIPHKDTPFHTMPAGSVKLTLILVALVRLILPEALLPATTALSTLDGKGLERGVLAGANVIMLNLTPPQERANYLLYNNKNATPAENITAISERMKAIGYNIIMGRGDHVSLKRP